MTAERGWKPEHTVLEYIEKISKKGKEIEEHLKREHHGVPESSCDRCVTLSATLRDLNYLLGEARKFEESKIS